MNQIPNEAASDVTQGFDAGDVCNRNGCSGVIIEGKREGDCSCHINPPCSFCTSQSDEEASQ